jgi:hypothetical protein
VSKPRYALLTVAAAAMTAVCGYAMTLPVPKARVAGGIGVAFFGACTLLLAYRLGGELAWREPFVVIDDDGVFDRRWSIGAIPWRDIAGLRVWEHRGKRVLCVDVVDPARWLARLSWWRRLSAHTNVRMGAGILNITFVGLRPGLDDALAFVRALRP